MASVDYVTIHSCTRQPMTNGLALLAHWSVREKLNRQFSSVQLRRSIHVLKWAVPNVLSPTIAYLCHVRV